MSKNLAHWEFKLQIALDDLAHAEQNLEVYWLYVVAPAKWRKDGSWRCFNGRDYDRQRKNWETYRRLASLAMQQKRKADQRVKYAKARIEALREKTVWTRVLGSPVV